MTADDVYGFTYVTRDGVLNEAVQGPAPADWLIYFYYRENYAGYTLARHGPQRRIIIELNQNTPWDEVKSELQHYNIGPNFTNHKDPEESRRRRLILSQLECMILNKERAREIHDNPPQKPQRGRK